MKKIMTIVCLFVLVLIGGGCHSKDQSSHAQKKHEIVMGVTGGPYNNLFDDAIAPILESEGYTIKRIEFSQFIQSNTALGEGKIDVNEYEMKINAANEEIQKQNPERLDQDEQNGQKKQEDALDTSKLLSIEEAAKIAEKQAGGGTATDWDLSKELGTTYWEVKVKNGNKSTQVKLNSQTGEVLATENDD